MTFASIEDGENRVRRGDGLPDIEFERDAVRTIPTRFDASQQTDLANATQACFGDTMTMFRQEMAAMVGLAAEQVNGIYEADYRDFDRDTYTRGRETFDRTARRRSGARAASEALHPVGIAGPAIVLAAARQSSAEGDPGPQDDRQPGRNAGRHALYP